LTLVAGETKTTTNKQTNKKTNTKKQAVATGDNTAVTQPKLLQKDLRLYYPRAAQW
jgi:hypothetical protein